jgi:hypothetical protein
MIFQNKFENIDMNWLISGRGEMLRNNQTTKNVNGIVENNVNGNNIQHAIPSDYQEIIKKKDEQIDRLLGIIEKFSINH